MAKATRSHRVIFKMTVLVCFCSMKWSDIGQTYTRDTTHKVRDVIRVWRSKVKITESHTCLVIFYGSASVHKFLNTKWMDIDQNYIAYTTHEVLGIWGQRWRSQGRIEWYSIIVFMCTISQHCVKGYWSHLYHRYYILLWCYGSD